MDGIITQNEAQKLYDMKVFVDVLADRGWTRCNGCSPTGWLSNTFRLGSANLECKDKDDAYMMKAESFIYFQDINNRNQDEAKAIRDSLSI